MSVLRVPVRRRRSSGGWRAVVSVDVMSLDDASKFAGGRRGLVDTGAETSGVSAGLAREMALYSELEMRMSTASHMSKSMAIHNLRMTFPFLGSFPVPRAYEFPGGLRGVDVIIGMDILMRLNCVIRERERVMELSLPGAGIFRRRFIRL